MTPIEALRAARQHGTEVFLVPGSIRLVAREALPNWLLDGLLAHKAAIIELLRPDASGWTGEDYHLYFEERAAILEYEHGLSPLEAEIRAQDECEAERARRQPPGPKETQLRAPPRAGFGV